MNRKKAKKKYFTENVIGRTTEERVNLIIDKIYDKHEAEVKELKERITELRWKCDTTTWGA